jgi:hypothetical protein
MLYDNLIGDPNDGVDSFGERAGRALNDMGKAAGRGGLQAHLLLRAPNAVELG